MQYLRQSLLTICICLYGLMAIAFGLSWLFPQANESAAERLWMASDLPLVADPPLEGELPITVELPLTALP